MTIITTIADDPEPPAIGELGKFRAKKLKKITKPLSRVAKPMLSMGKGGGLLTAIGPWGWAAGAALATGTALAAKHRAKKQRARQQQAEEIVTNQQTANEIISPPQPEIITAPTFDQPSDPLPEIQTSTPIYYPSEIPSAAETAPITNTDVILAPENPETPAFIESDPVTIAGLSDNETMRQPSDWNNLALLAGFSLGMWWIVAKRK
jgi:hypothetical protein